MNQATATVATVLSAAVLATLSEYDFVVVVDKSGSMGTEDMSGGRSRWDAMQETAVSFARDICKIDSDGIGLVLFSGTSVVSKDGCKVADVESLFASNRPSGSTPLAQALTEALKLAGKSNKKDFVIVFTDGVPDDKAAAAKVLVDAANGLDTDDQLTFLFVQVGTDAAAGAYLASLDDALTGAKFDIVDAKTMAEAEAFPSTAELVVAAING